MAYIEPAWRPLTRILCIPQIIPLIALWFVPESPRWLYSQGRLAEAESVLVKIAKRNGVHQPVLSLIKKPSESKKTNFTVVDALKHKTTRKRLLVLGYVWFVCSFVYYGLTLAAGDIGDNPYVSEVLSGLVELPTLLLTGYILDRKWCGRKRGLCSTLLLSGVAGFILMFCQEKNLFKMVVGLCGKMVIATAFNTLYIYAPELFPTVVRNAALGSQSMCARVGGILSAYMKTLILINHVAGYLIISITGITAGLLSFFLPETLGTKPPDSF
uniref:Major facilitator superfamily (MFS) profile domain-containing protein n=1 Tax=Ciona savignyi TaxID=51511 RepID=H2YQZ9_CIOSA